MSKVLNSSSSSNTSALTLATVNNKLKNYLNYDKDGLITLPAGGVITKGGDFNGATATEIGYLEGVKSHIQDQLDTITNNVNNAATLEWVEAKNYLTSVPSTYATHDWVSSQNYLPKSGGDINGVLATNDQVYICGGIEVQQGTFHVWDCPSTLTGGVYVDNLTVGDKINDILNVDRLFVNQHGATISGGLGVTGATTTDGLYVNTPRGHFYFAIDGTELTGGLNTDTLTIDGKSAATQDWVTSQNYLTSIPENYTTQNWVTSQGYLKDSDINSIYIKWSTLPAYITQSDLTTQLSNANYLTSTNLPMYLLNYATLTQLSNYATQSWVQSKNYLTAVPSTYLLKTDADATYVSNSSLTTTLGSYATTTSLNSYLPKIGGSLSGKLTISSGGISNTGGLTTDSLTVQSAGETDSGSLNVTGLISANGGLTVVGGLTTDSLTVQSGGETDSGNLTVTGAINANGGLTVATGKTLTLNAPITMNTFVTPTATQIGYLMSATATSVASAQLLTSNTDTVICSLSLTPGVWSLLGMIQFLTQTSSNSSGDRIFASVSKTTAIDSTFQTRVSCNGFSFTATGGSLFLQSSALVTVTTTTTYNLIGRAYFTTASPALAFSSNSNLVAVRIA
jgi:hypothetical protein